MAYNYLDLTNEVNRRLNEVELTSTNFASAKGFHSQIKDSINSSLRDINDHHHEWPFHHITAEETLTAGITRYAFPSDANTIDFDSFRIKESSTFGNGTQKLDLISYEDYLGKYVEQEYKPDTSTCKLPTMVFHAPSLEYGVSPAPDQDYVCVYEYYRVPVDLSDYTDVPAVPERFRGVIIDGAMYHAYMFRSNEQAANIAKNKFEEGLKRMRTILVNRYHYVRSSVVNNGGGYAVFGERVR